MNAYFKDSGRDIATNRYINDQIAAINWHQLNEEPMANDPLSDIRATVFSINNTLHEVGYSWEEVEIFWDECMKECKEGHSYEDGVQLGPTTTAHAHGNADHDLKIKK
jgi:hypothetical protein